MINGVIRLGSVGEGQSGNHVPDLEQQSRAEKSELKISQYISHNCSIPAELKRQVHQVSLNREVGIVCACVYTCEHFYTGICQHVRVCVYMRLYEVCVHMCCVQICMHEQRCM